MFSAYSSFTLRIVRRVVLLCLITLLVITSLTSSFNLDLKSPIILQPPTQKGIHFGFSLAHIFNGTERRLLVGAPKANTTQKDARPGALYSCTLEGSPRCQQLSVDTREDKYRPWITHELKDDQRLGYSLAANDKSIVVCAPRWHVYEDTKIGIKDLPLGKCFAAEAPKYKFEPFSPPYIHSPSVQDIHFGNNGSCQIGMSLTYVKGRNSISLGSPGCWSWQGDTWEIGLDSLETDTNLRRVQELTFDDVDLNYDYDASSGFNTIADLYLGYSVASMIYAQVPALVSAMPKTVGTNDLRVINSEKNQVLGPMVYIFQEHPSDKHKLTVLDKIKPPKNQSNPREASMESMFSYFGYSLTTADVDGDGLEDVIVGAPFYHNSTHHDQGAIFVYRQSTFEVDGDVPIQYEMKEEKNAPLRRGRESYGRFGSCVAAIGDIDSDGFDDIAVGAPFLKDGGAVFIYLGSPAGLEERYRQEIRASEIPSVVQPLSGFGFSIAQRFPDRRKEKFEVAVGAYNSDVVAVFKSKEVVTLHWNITFDSQMDLTTNRCFVTGEVSGMYPCVIAQVCFIYTKNLPSSTTKSLNFGIKLTADINEQPKRLFFENNRDDYETKINLKENKWECIDINIMARKEETVTIKTYVIQGEVSFLKQDDDTVVLDPRTTLTKKEELEIKLMCEGETGTCISDLRLTTKPLTDYELASSQDIIVRFRVENFGAAAYNTRLELSSPDLTYPEVRGENVTCETNKDKQIVVCEIAVIFKNGSKVEFDLLTTPSEGFFASLETHKDFFQVDAKLTTTSEIINPEAAEASIKIPIIVKGNLDLTKEQSQPAIVYYNSSSYYKDPSDADNERELGPEIVHKYKIFNRNKYTIYRTQITIMWPLKIDGNYLLYLMEKPEFIGAKPACNYTNGEIDPFKLKKQLNAVRNSGEFNPRPTLGADRYLLGKELADMVDYLQFHCTFGELTDGKEVYIQLRSRLVQRTIEKLEVGSNLRTVSSMSQLQVLQMPLGVARPEPSHQSLISTEISYQNESLEDVMPWWVYLVSILGGLLLLIFISLILWKCGFFKRKRGEVVDGAEKDDVKNDAECENGEDEEDGDPVTPHSPMLKETENANDDFEYSKS